jgi:hypothetical protein
MISGKPILASYSGYKSMINEANCGVYVEAGNIFELQEQIKNFLNMDKLARAEMGMRGKAWLCDNRQYKKLALDLFKVII